jgi:Ca-activated chloride channel family protein
MTRIVVEAWWPLVVLALVLPLILWLAVRSLSPLSGRHRVLLTAVRLLALACAAGALMRPSWLGQSTDVSVIYALDVSKSVDPAFIDAAIRWMDRARLESPAAGARFVAFADRPRFVDSPEAIRAVPLATRPGASPEALDPLVTDLERALESMAGAFEPKALKRVVLMTDGNATRGDPWRVLERLRARGVRVFPVPALVRPGSDVWIAGVDLPPELRRDEPAQVVVRLQAQSAGRAEVRLLRSGRLLQSRPVTLVAGENAVRFTVRIPEDGATSVTAEVRAEGDTLRDNDRLVAPVRVHPRPRVLLVQGIPGTAQSLRDALTASGFAVQVAAPEAVPATGDALDPFDAVVLANVSAAALGAERMAALARHAREQGGGLVFASGPDVYGDAGYRESALEEALPVTFEAQEKRRDLALVIVLDRSYSMKGRKLDLAKAATLGALDLLEEEHRFAVVTFDSQPEITVPLAQVRSKRKAEDLISRFTASGQTNIYPALQMAYRMLVDVPVKAKHVILLSDGDTQPADFQRLVKRMAEAQITVSSVAIGGEADRDLLGKIAGWGRGRFHYAETADRVPQIFIEETQRLVNESVREEPFRVVVKQPAEALRDIEFAKAPMLKGYASMKPRDRAEVWLTTETGAPLLARWQVGLGKAVVFASDAENRWAADWLAWPGYGKFWSQLVRETMRRRVREGAGFEARALPGGDTLVGLTLLTPDGGFRNGLSPRVRIQAPGRPDRIVALRQSGPGRYELRWPAERSVRGATRFELADGVPADVRAEAGVRDVVEAYPEEYRLKPVDRTFLEALATQTGGKLAPEPRDVFAPQGEAATVPRPLWPWFAGAALVLYLLDLLVRRLPGLRRRLG